MLMQWVMFAAVAYLHPKFAAGYCAVEKIARLNEFYINVFPRECWHWTWKNARHNIVNRWHSVSHNVWLFLKWVFFQFQHFSAVLPLRTFICVRNYIYIYIYPFQQILIGCFIITCSCSGNSWDLVHLAIFSAVRYINIFFNRSFLPIKVVLQVAYGGGKFQFA